MRFVVLGGYGIIGRAVVEDLFNFSSGEIIIAGRDKEKARIFAEKFRSPRVKWEQVEVNDVKKLTKILSDSVVVNCLQYQFNLTVMSVCLNAKVSYCDLGGLYHKTKEQLKMNEEFRKIGKTAVLGCGSTPGITNVMIAHASNKLNKITDVDITFADVDYTKYTHSFVLPYSFKTLVDEHTQRPAVFENRKIRFVEPLSGKKEYNFIKPFGKMNGYYSLHSELATIPDFLKHKGIKNCSFRVTFEDKFSGILKDLISLGLTSKDYVKYNGFTLPIIDYSTSVMDKLIPSGVKINDEEILQIYLNKKFTMTAHTKSKGEYAAGVRDTAIPCSIIAQFLASGIVSLPGVHAPESVVTPSIFFKELGKRGIRIFENKELIS